MWLCISPYTVTPQPSHIQGVIMSVTNPIAVLLIDGDNIPLPRTREIVQYCEQRYRLSIKRAYGDWKKQLKSHALYVEQSGVEPVQQDAGKNATDFALAMDAAELLREEEYQTFIIVSSDGDFSALCQRVKRKNRRVVIIGLAESPLKKHCDEFVPLTRVNKPAVKPTSPPAKAVPLAKPATPAPLAPSKVAPQPSCVTKAPQSQTSAKTSSDDLLALLKSAYAAAIKKDGWVYLPQMREALMKDERFEVFAKKKLSSLFTPFPQVFKLEAHRVQLKDV
jgi:uncharacterized LabA/DUF88 family protein